MSDDLDTVEGERGMPAVNDPGSGSRAKRRLALAGLLAVVAAGVAAGYWKNAQWEKRQAEADKAKMMSNRSAVPPRVFTPPPASPPAPPATPSPGPAMPGAAPGPAPVLPGPAPVPGAGPTPKGSPPRVPPKLDKSGSELMLNTGTKNGEPVIPPPGGGGEEKGGLDGLLIATKTPARMAGKLGDRSFILAKGSYVDCTLQTRLDSTVPGMTACVVTRNVYSDNGKIVLIERGSTVTGEYQSNLRQGMRRIFVLWNRIKTPNGVIVSLDSPGTDPLGGAGIPGWLDTHFFERFGAAIMMSLIQDVVRYGLLAFGGSGDNNNISFNATGAAAQSMGVETLRQSINIPPTLYKNQGEQVGIFVARDLDFSGVYDVRAEE